MAKRWESVLLGAHNVLWALHTSLLALGKLDVNLDVVRYSTDLHVTEVILCLAACRASADIRIFAIKEFCDFLQGYALDAKLV